jgi:hypothetical protein
LELPPQVQALVDAITALPGVAGCFCGPKPLAGIEPKDTGVVRLDIIMERRKALEWVMDPACDWDNVELGT